MNHTKIYGTTAVLAVGLFYFVLELLPGNASYQYLFLPMVSFSAAAAAVTSSVVLQRIGWWPRFQKHSRTGIVRGAAVVGVAHLMFGLYFFIASEFDSLIDSFYGQYSESSSSAIEEILWMSVMSFVALPVTLLAGCLGGIYAEKRSGHLGAQGK